MTITIDLKEAAQVLIFGGFLWAACSCSPWRLWRWRGYEADDDTEDQEDQPQPKALRAQTKAVCEQALMAARRRAAQQSLAV
ncbi:hypothetical protein [Pseudomonas aeruginosa]|uniref:hypothetical protein n=1 Tax=Pseudomonas aeruginosa TaxID=287 RepID=UPI001F4B745F|nr:hypothetical protein [Pseudomonas aeruginosa]HCE6244635.1 hypothetical protein [Pseudomonas aeruginosa]